MYYKRDIENETSTAEFPRLNIWKNKPTPQVYENNGNDHDDDDDNNNKNNNN